MAHESLANLRKINAATSVNQSLYTAYRSASWYPVVISGTSEMSGNDVSTPAAMLSSSRSSKYMMASSNTTSRRVRCPSSARNSIACRWLVLLAL